jgi:hypothetical protein
MTLRNGLLAVAGIAFIIAIVLIVAGAGIMSALAVALGAVVVVLAIIFERRGYDPKAVDSAALRRTDERMIDPVSGKLVEVWEDPRTGAREYREVEAGR